MSALIQRCDLISAIFARSHMLEGKKYRTHAMYMASLPLCRPPHSDVLYRHYKNHGPEAMKKFSERSKAKKGHKQIGSPEGLLQDQRIDNASLDGSSSSQRSPNGSQGLSEELSEWNIIVATTVQQPSPDVSNNSTGSWSHHESNPGVPAHNPGHVTPGHQAGPESEDNPPAMTMQTHLTNPEQAMISSHVASNEVCAPLEIAMAIPPQQGPLLTGSTIPQTIGELRYPLSQAEDTGTPMVLDGGSPFTLPQEDWWLSFGDFDMSTVPNVITLDAPEVIADGNRNGIAPVPPADDEVHSGENSHDHAMTPLSKQLPRLQHVWARRSSEASKPMANLWHALSTGKGLFGNLEEIPISNSNNKVRRYRNLANETKQQVCNVFQSMLKPTTGDVSASLPAPESVEIAYEHFWIHQHNVAPVVHAPTFRAERAPLDLVVTMCTIGFSVMGTPELNRLVDRVYPSLLKRVSELLQTAENNENVKLTDRLETMITVLLTMNLGAIKSAIEVFFATEPTLQIDAVYVMPVCDSELFEASILERWCQMRPDFHQMAYPVVSASYSKTPTVARSYDMMYTLLMILQLRFSAASLVLERATQQGDAPPSSPPWKVFGRDIRTKCLVGLTVDLVRAAIPKDRNFEMNSAVSWHALCLSLTANIRLLETAAGRSGPEAASQAMKEVSVWAQTPTARRAALHATHIFYLLFKRRFCDPVKLHTIISLFQAALVLGFYICARKHPDTPQVFHVYGTINWADLGVFGLTDEAPDLPPEIMQLPEAQYIVQEQTIAFGDFIITSGITEARKCWLQFASLMIGLGRWKSRAFSRILHVMCDSLSEGESAAGGNHGEKA
ncbi:C2H2 type zinc finger domain-containing protein [Fusarium mundagurra]|uniref:C2H2 type zinc finger domain-containing protein n=1 Tax=Fusarium mundagurra TaxID=1567541 RepID=A0A8H5YKL5_9HYPO|nr:C2H2 type zinc finger domain-containing protein [Fusarium mundagurra]